MDNQKKIITDVTTRLFSIQLSTGRQVTDSIYFDPREEEPWEDLPSPSIEMKKEQSSQGLQIRGNFLSVTGRLDLQTKLAAKTIPLLLIGTNKDASDLLYLWICFPAMKTLSSQFTISTFAFGKLT